MADEADKKVERTSNPESSSSTTDDTEVQPKPEAPTPLDETASKEPEKASERANKQHLPKKAIIAVVAVVIAAVVGLTIANAAGAFHQHTWADATCTEPRHCTECGATEGEPLGHDYQEEDIAATCTEGGKRVYTCSRCHDTYSEDDGTPATGHTAGDWAIDTASMKMVQKCTTCGETLDSRDMTRDDVDQVLVSQEVTLDNIKKEVYSDAYKALYPDAIAMTITNHSDKVIKYVNMQVCSWDSNGYPVATKLAYDFSGSNNDFAQMYLDDANLEPGKTWDSDQKNWVWNLDFNTSPNIASIRGCITSVGYMDGTTWNNPYAEAWLKLYENQQL